MNDKPYDEQYADRMVTDDEVSVEYDAEPNDDGSLITIRRTVWRRHRLRKHQDILWQADAVVIPREQASSLVRDIVASVAT